MLIHCKPTGFTYHSRKIETGDIAALADQAEEEQERGGRRRRRRRSRDELQESSIGDDPTVIAILRQVAGPEGVQDPGPYKMTLGQPVDWGMLTAADINAAAVEVRRLTKSMHEIRPPCGYCKRLPTESQGVDLNDIEVFSCSEEGLEAIRTGEPIVYRYDAEGEILGKGEGEENLYLTVAHRPVLGKNLAALGELQAGSPIRGIDWQIVFGIEWLQLAGSEKQVKGNRPVMDVYKHLNLGLREAIDADQEELWGGPDTLIEWACDHESCGREQEMYLPLDVAFFGGTPGRRRRRRRRSS